MLLANWTYWWEFNKTPFLDLKPAAGRPPREEEIHRSVVPALLKALETETNNDIVTGCMVALAKIGDEKDESGTSRFEEAIKPKLKSKVQEIAETAALALGILGHESSVGTLAALMRDGAEGRALVGGNEVSLRTRAFAAYGLSLIGAQMADESTRSAIISHLISVLETDKSSTRDLQVACLIALGLVPLERISPATPAAEDELPPPQESRVGQLEYLLAYLANHDNHAIVRAHVPAGLVRLLDHMPPKDRGLYKQRIAGVLLAGCGKDSTEPAQIIQSCVLALGQLGDDDADELDASIRAALMRATGELGDLQARCFSLIALAEAGGRAGQGARGESDDVARHLVQHLKGAAALRPWAALALGVYGRALLDRGIPAPADVETSLRGQLLGAKSPEQIASCAIAAGLLKDRGAQQDLLGKLAVKDDTARGYVALALGLLRSAEAAERVRLIVLESAHRPDVLRQATIGLAMLGERRAVPDLLRMLAEARAMSHQAALALALGAIGDPSSIEPLVAMLQNEDVSNSTRGFAAVALGIVADKEARPWNSRISLGLNYRASTTTLYDQQGCGILDIL